MESSKHFDRKAISNLVDELIFIIDRYSNAEVEIPLTIIGSFNIKKPNLHKNTDDDIYFKVHIKASIDKNNSIKLNSVINLDRADKFLERAYLFKTFELRIELSDRLIDDKAILNERAGFCLCILKDSKYRKEHYKIRYTHSLDEKLAELDKELPYMVIFLLLERIKLFVFNQSENIYSLTNAKKVVAQSTKLKIILNIAIKAALNSEKVNRLDEIVIMTLGIWLAKMSYPDMFSIRKSYEQKLQEFSKWLIIYNKRQELFI